MGIAPVPFTKNPDSLGAVGLPVWLWVAQETPNSTGPITASATEQGYTVSLVAKRSDIEWDLGDGSEKIHCGLGIEFNPRTMNPDTPVACGRQHGYQKQGEYTITATTHWKIEWAGIGQSGTIEMTQTTSDQVRIGEIQTVNIPKERRR